MDASAGMTAEKTADLNLHDHAAVLLADNREGAVLFRTACTADGENTLILRVQIDHAAALQLGDIQSLRSKEANLLIHRKYTLKRRVRNGIVLQKGKHHGNGNSIVSAKRRSLRI